MSSPTPSPTRAPIESPTRRRADLRVATAIAASLLLAACSGGETPAPESAPESPQSGLAERAAESIDPDVTAADSAAEAIRAAITGEHRSPGNAERNAARHPVETLLFFGFEPGMTVVEVWPGGGTAWYTEVLAPALGADGTLIAAGYSPDDEVGYFAAAAEAFSEKIAAHPKVYANTRVIDYGDPERAALAPGETADQVLLFRLYHNAIRGDVADEIMADAYAALKPGGVLGVVQHRSPEDAPDEREMRDGYVKESTVIADAEAAGFELAGRSEINANPADDADHPQGVWTLPPSMALCDDLEGEEKTACRAEWSAIGESDRMTLKFVKPAA